MHKGWLKLLSISFAVLLLFGCGLLEESTDQAGVETVNVTPLDELVDIDLFRHDALAHILEGEINKKEQAVGFHYDRLPTKKGEIISGTKTAENEFGIYEAEVTVEGVEKSGNRGISSFFPDAWDSQDVVDAINEAYDTKAYISGNTYEGLTSEGIVVRMYLDQSDKIISAFPVY